MYDGLESLSDRSFEGFVWKLVGELKNGIASRGQSVISHEHLAQFRDNPQFEEFLREIIITPLDNELFFKFNEWWMSQPGVKHNRVLINRIFAACAPTELSTLVDEGKFNRLFAWLQSEEIIGRYRSPHSGDTWLSRNIFLTKELHNVNRGGLPGEWISLFPWLLFEYMERQQEKAGVSQGEGFPEFVESMPFSINAFFNALDGAGLMSDVTLPTALISALPAKPFLILTGLSGSGKTLQALSFAKWICPKKAGGFYDKLKKVLESDKIIENYDVHSCSSQTVELVNKRGNSGKIIPLPVGAIEEWYLALKNGVIDVDKDPKDTRHTVGESSAYQKYIHGFYTELKKLGAAVLELPDTGGGKTGPKQYELISVGADWTSNENLLGYPDALKENSYRKPDNGALDFILRAKDDPENPYFLILDEMNLSHVERYFADFLSAMESGEAISLHADTGADWNGVPAKLKIPKNLFVIGTVNVDETTYMFSPKVLDRANVIEFRVSDDEMKSFLANPMKPDLESISGHGVQYAKAFVAAAKQKDVPLDAEARGQVSDVLMEFFPELKEAGAEFGYRTAHEICRFVYFYKEFSNDWKFESAMDAAIMQKLLPKLHGSKKKLGPVLAALIRLCLKEDARPESDPIKDEVLTKGNALYPGSLEKLARMRKRLAEHGFTSFAEA
ncbi:MAG: hypothetical protein PF495_16480 [Spirochaetales bacterium]|nr:hypothetical protein [Spirochaetales bacterium]